MKRSFSKLALGVLSAGLVAALGSVAFAQDAAADLEVTIDGRDLRDAAAGEPMILDPEQQETVVVVSVTNNTSEEMGIRAVRMSGDVLGATFFSYDTAVEMRIPPGETQDRTFSLDLFGLSGQAVGLIPASVALIDLDREAFVEQRFVGDVQGSIRSTFGYFGMGIAFLTLLGFFNAFRNLAKNDLSEKRYQRSATFALPGAGLGLSIVFGLSLFRIFVPTDQTAGWITTVSLAVFAIFGYFTPNPEEEDEPVAPSRGGHALRPSPPPPIDTRESIRS